MLKNIQLSYLLFHSVTEIFFNLKEFKKILETCGSPAARLPNGLSLTLLFHSLAYTP